VEVDSEQCQVLEARWRLSVIAPSDLHRVADQLLAAGEDAHALTRLFALQDHELPWEGPPVFEELLREWGGGSLTLVASVPVMLRDVARQLLAGSLTPAQATTTIYEIDVVTDRSHPTLNPWRQLCEELWPDMGPNDRSSLGRTRAEVERDVITLATQTLES
jgi:hypothetical protein